MRISLFFAHGEQLIPVFVGIVVAANASAVASIVIAKRKKKDARSMTAFTLAVIAFLIGAWIFPVGITGILGMFASIPIIAPSVLAVIGAILSVRRSKNA